MKAVICTKYGPPKILQLTEVPKPTPKNDEVCIRIYATAVTNSDIFIRGSELPLRVLIPFRLYMGLTKPRKAIIGEALAGEIEAVGKPLSDLNRVIRFMV